MKLAIVFVFALIAIAFAQALEEDEPRNPHDCICFSIEDPVCDNKRNEHASVFSNALINTGAIAGKQGDGFTIENRIIKGDEKCYDVKEHNIGELIFNKLSQSPECIGEVDAVSGKSKTFAEIKEQSILLAAWMRKQGIGPGDVVSVCSPRDPHIVIIFYATVFVGAAYYPFSCHADLVSSRRLINMLPPRLIFAHKNNIGVLEEAAMLENHKWNIIQLNSDCNDNIFNAILQTPLPDEEIKYFQLTKVRPESNCIVIPTSGTTGTPKLIPTDYQTMLHTVFTDGPIGALNVENMIVLSYFSPEWVIDLIFSVKCLLNKWTQIYHYEFDSREICKIIEKYKITFLYLDVYEILQLTQAGAINDDYDLKSVTFISACGAKVFYEIRRKILDIFSNVHFIGKTYGLTETGPLTLFTRKCVNPDSEGRVIPNVQLKIIDNTTGLALGHNKVGEVCIKGPCVMTGYYKNPTANKLAFDDEGWFHSGDEGYYDENGEIFIVGRLKEMIRHRLTDIYPSYIEQSLFSHPNIVDAAVIGINHNLYVEQPVAFVKVTHGSNVTEEDVLKLIPKLEYDDTFKNWIIFADEIPRSANGKIKRRILQERAEIFYKSRL